MDAKTIWRAVDYDSLLIQEWQGEGEFAVYQPESARTHFLDSFGMQLLADLHHEPARCASEAELAAGLARRIQLPLTAALIADVQAALCSFDELGLVVQVEQKVSLAG